MSRSRAAHNNPAVPGKEKNRASKTQTGIGKLTAFARLHCAETCSNIHKYDCGKCRDHQFTLKTFFQEGLRMGRAARFSDNPKSAWNDLPIPLRILYVADYRSQIVWTYYIRIPAQIAYNGWTFSGSAIPWSGFLRHCARLGIYLFIKRHAKR
jgi:hypothetical protein